MKNSISQTAWLAALLPLAAGTACDRVTEPVACTAIAVSSLNVTVRDAATSGRLCDATVTAVLAGVSYELRRSGRPDSTGCTYAGPEERAGIFEVRVSRSGYAAAVVANVQVTADVCHVIPVALTVDLHPSA
jgi:hypothetical protein